MGLAELEDFDSIKEALEEAGENLVVIDITANWCGPCKALGPLLEKVEEESENINFFKVNIDNNEHFAAMHKVSCVPTILFFKNQEIIDRVTGANIDKIKETIVKYSV